MHKRPYFTLPDGALWAPSRGAATSGLIIIPPLIGDTAVSQLHRFRSLRREGFALYTFAFPGHPGADGRFCLRAAAERTRRHMALAGARARSMVAPLLGLGCCAAAIPLLKAAHAAQAPPVRLALLNPVVRFSPATLLSTFWRYSHERSRNPLERVRALPTYLEHLFPGIVMDAHRFGALYRRRVALPHLLSELLGDRLLAAVRLERTPVLCCYGEADALLQELIPQGADTYETTIRRHCPQVVFKPLTGTHQLSGSRLRTHLRRIIRSFFTAATK